MNLKSISRAATISLVFLAAFLSYNQTVKAQMSLSVTVTGIKGEKGNLLFSIYNENSEFPGVPLEYFNVPKDKKIQDAIEHTFTGLEPGKYAVVVIDDEDINEELTKGFMGIPREGYVFSNGARPKGFRMPSFEECLIDLRNGSSGIRMELIYHQK